MKSLILLNFLFTLSYVSGKSIQLHEPRCSGNFSSAQREFLRSLLQEEAKGLTSGMMKAFSTPKGKWSILSREIVCFGARDDQFGTFIIETEGFLSAIKLVHVSGSVTCDNTVCANNQNLYNSKWGCATTHPYLGKTPLNTVITTSNNKIVFPKDHHFTHDHTSLWFHLDQFDSHSDLLVFQRFQDPLYVADGQELRLWFGEDLKNVSEDDNGGKTCARVFGFYL